MDENKHTTDNTEQHISTRTSAKHKVISPENFPYYYNGNFYLFSILYINLGGYLVRRASREENFKELLKYRTERINNSNLISESHYWIGVAYNDFYKETIKPFIIFLIAQRLYMIAKYMYSHKPILKYKNKEEKTPMTDFSKLIKLYYNNDDYVKIDMIDVFC